MVSRPCTSASQGDPGQLAAGEVFGAPNLHRAFEFVAPEMRVEELGEVLSEGVTGLGRGGGQPFPFDNGTEIDQRAEGFVTDRLPSVLAVPADTASRPSLAHHDRVASTSDSSCCAQTLRLPGDEMGGVASAGSWNGRGCIMEPVSGWARPSR